MCAPWPLLQPCYLWSNSSHSGPSRWLFGWRNVGDSQQRTGYRHQVRPSRNRLSILLEQHLYKFCLFSLLLNAFIGLHIISLFLAKTMEDIGIDRHAPMTNVKSKWDYTTLKNTATLDPENEKWVTSIYRGLVPAKNIEIRDFAIAGGMVNKIFLFFFFLNNILPPPKKKSFLPI